MVERLCAAVVGCSSHHLVYFEKTFWHYTDYPHPPRWVRHIAQVRSYGRYGRLGATPSLGELFGLAAKLRF